MELSERCIAILEKEGFLHIYEWQDAPGTVYEAHYHQGKVTIWVTDGSIMFNLNGEKKEIKPTERFDVPTGVSHSAVVGLQGAIYIVGEEIEGDS